MRKSTILTPSVLTPTDNNMGVFSLRGNKIIGQNRHVQYFIYAYMVLVTLTIVTLNVFKYMTVISPSIIQPYGYGPSPEDVYRLYNHSSLDSIRRADPRFPPLPLKFKMPSYNLSRQCIKGHVHNLIQRYIHTFDPKEHLFLSPGYKSWNYTGDPLFEMSQPFGLGKNNVDMIDRLLTLLPGSNKPDRFGDGCKRCVLVGNSGVLIGKKLGEEIDKYDIVFRMNKAKVGGFEKDVGSKTSFRIIFAGSAVSDKADLNPSEDVVLYATSSVDYMWLESMLNKSQSCPPCDHRMPGYRLPSNFTHPPSQIRILNPHMVFLTSYDHIGMRNVPTTGAIALVTALHYCDHVDMAGFTSFESNAPEHYFEEVRGPGLGHHNFKQEKFYILHLIQQGVVGRDLTGYYTDTLRKGVERQKP